MSEPIPLDIAFVLAMIIATTLTAIMTLSTVLANG